MVVCDQVLNPESIPISSLESCFASSRSIFGCSFSSEGENLIYGGGQCSYRFFSFSTPFNEDQIVEYLKILLKNESIEEGNEQINIQFIHQLLEAYESQKQNLNTFNEEEEEEEEEEEKGEEEEEEKGDEVKERC